MSEALNAARERIAQLASTGASTADALAEILTLAQEARNHANLLQRYVDATGPAIKAYVQASSAPLIARIQTLEADRSKALDAPAEPNFRGDFTPILNYSKGDVVADRGYRWLRTATTPAGHRDDPDVSSPNWRRLGRIDLPCDLTTTT